MFTPNQISTPKTANMMRKNDQDKVQVQEFQRVIPPKVVVTEKDFLPLQQLGRGSFGDVYLVKDLFPNSGKLYAMKVLNKRSKQEESWLRYIKTERDVLATSDNEFIVKLHFAFQT